MEVPPFQVKIGVVYPEERKTRGRGHRDFFFDFFNENRGKVLEKSISSKKAYLKIKPLPREGRPKDFTGLVGEFSVIGGLSTRNLKVGDTTTLTVSIEGQGLTESLGKYSPTFPSHIKIYEDKPTNEQKYELRRGLLSKRVHKFALVPTKTGTIDLQKITLSYFSPQKQKYVKVQVPLGKITVSPSSDSEKRVVVGPGSSGKGSLKSKVTTLNQDLIDIHRQLSENSKPLTPSELLQFVSIALGVFLYIF